MPPLPIRVALLAAALAESGRSTAPALRLLVEAASDAPCAFAEDLRGVECFGLHAAPPGVGSADACKAVCCPQSNCTIWQYCGDFTTYCGSEHGGCYIGDGATHCQRSHHCTGLDCWDGGCRGSRCPSIPPAPPPPPPPPPTCGSDGAAPCAVDLTELGLRFDGIGGITSNGECRLLYDYPEPQRSEVLDYLFLPKFGLSVQILKVEIGSDAQSTVGTEPSYQHTEGLISYDRGIQFWFMTEARKRNPRIVIAALEWSAPSWVGSRTPEYGCPGWAGCAFFTDKNIDYILGWMKGAIDVWHIDPIDYIGVWNEPPIPYIPPAWLIQLRERLDHAGYNSTQLVAPDASSTGSQVLKLLDDMLNTSKLADAVDVIGTHGFWDAPPTSFQELTSRYAKNAKRAWVSESWHQMGTWNGAKGMVSKVLAAQQQGYSGWTAWGLLFAAYPVTLCQDKGLLYSTQPWAGSYNIQGTVWTTAHFTQFSEPGWSWLAEGNGTGTFGTAGSRFATLVNPKTGDWSLIVNNLDSSTSERVRFAVRNTPLGNRLTMFATNETSWFKEQTPPAVDPSGEFVLDVGPETIYSLTTLSGRAVPRKGLHPHSELAAPFPLPHADNFSSYADGRSPRYFTDWDGSFSVDHGVLKQQVLKPPIRWHCTDVDPITLVGPGYANYDVSAKARIDSINGASQQHAGNTSATYIAVCARQQKPFKSWCPSASGYCLRLHTTGDWSLLAGASTIAHGAAGVQPGAHAWHTLRLRVYGTKIEASVDGSLLTQVEDSSFDNGPAALGSGYHYASFAAFEMRALSSTLASVPPGSKAVAYPVFTGTELSAASAKEFTGQFGLAFTPLLDLTVTALARFAAAGPSGVHQLTIHCAAHNATQVDPRCRTEPQGLAVWEGLASAKVDYNVPNVDATGMVWAPVRATSIPHAASLKVVANQQYFLVSAEGSDKSPNDRFYTTTKTYPCIGDPGPGGTLPKLDVQIPGVHIDGGVFRLANASVPCSSPQQCPHGEWQPLLWDYRPRSFGPLSFAVADTTSK